MIRFHSDGERRFRLESADGRDIGWIRGRAIGFGGLYTEEQAIGAVRRVLPVFDAVLRRHFADWVSRRTHGAELRLAHDGAHEWVSMGAQPLARLLRPQSRRADGDFAIEFVLPTCVRESAAVSVAQTLGAAMQAYLASTRHWSVWARAVAHDTTRSDRVADHAIAVCDCCPT